MRVFLNIFNFFFRLNVEPQKFLAGLPMCVFTTQYQPAAAANSDFSWGELFSSFPCSFRSVLGQDLTINFCCASQKKIENFPSGSTEHEVQESTWNI